VRWVVKVGARYWSAHTWTDYVWMATIYPSSAAAMNVVNHFWTQDIKNARIVKLVAKGTKAKKSLEGRVVVLEAQVRSLQVALPKGVRHG
jgi:hypothetical protein